MVSYRLSWITYLKKTGNWNVISVFTYVYKILTDSDKHNFLDVISAIEIDEILISNPDAKKIFVKMYTHVVKENWINASFDNYLKLVTIFKKVNCYLFTAIRKLLK